MYTNPGSHNITDTKPGIGGRSTGNQPTASQASMAMQGPQPRMYGSQPQSTQSTPENTVQLQQTLTNPVSNPQGYQQYVPNPQGYQQYVSNPQGYQQYASSPQGYQQYVSDPQGYRQYESYAPRTRTTSTQQFQAGKSARNTSSRGDGVRHGHGAPPPSYRSGDRVS